MSVEENKRNHQRIHEELWMKGNIDVIDELFDPDATYVGVRDTKELKRRFGEWIANPNTPRPTKVEHHAKIGEGDYLAIWQTNQRSDGTIVEGVTIQRWNNGKLAESHWFTRPDQAPQPD